MVDKKKDDTTEVDKHKDDSGTTPAPQPVYPRLVKAKQMVFYGGMRIRPGKTFSITEPAHFSEKSMEYVESGVDETAKAVESSPKQRGSAGVMRKPGASTAALEGTLATDPGI